MLFAIRAPRPSPLRDNGSVQPWGSVDPELATLLRPGLPGVVEEIIAVIRAEVPEYDQPLEGAFGRLISQGVSVALEQFVSLLGRDEELPEIGTYEALGRAEHRAGRTLDALQSAYRLGARVAWRSVAQVGAASGVDPREMYALAEAIFAYIDRLAGASVAGFSQAEALRVGALQARRQALVELFAAPGAPNAGEVAAAAEQAGWDPPPRTVAALVVAGDAVSLARRAPTGTIAAALEPAGVALVPDPEGPGRAAQLTDAVRRRRAVLGPTVQWSEAHVSVARALAAWPLHVEGRMGDEPLARAEEHLVALLLAAEPRVTGDLVRRRLAPLTELKPGARARAEATLRAWLAAHGDVSAAAAALHVHPQTVRYRLAAVRDTLGASTLDEPAARLELALALQATAASRRPGAAATPGDETGSGAGDATGFREPPPGNA